MAMRFASRRYWHEPRALAVLLVCIALLVWRATATNERQPPPARLEEDMHTVRRVVDGDTLLLESGARVRLQGIDTPETVLENSPIEPWGPEASAFTKAFIADANERVRLTFSLKRKDRHERFLAFVWHGDAMLNEELVRAGLAHARLDYRYAPTMKRRLASAEQEAQRAKRGMWSNSLGVVGSTAP
jgi:micrococcal nuclease